MRVLVEGEIVLGWIRSRRGLVWEAVLTPKVEPNETVNLAIDGYPLGFFDRLKNAEDALCRSYRDRTNA